MNTSEVLNRAADVIEERGWTQGGDSNDQPWDGPNGVCLEGGIAAAAGLDRRFGGFPDLYNGCPAYEAVVSHLGLNPMPKRGGAPIMDAVWQWNDKPGRTASEVIEVLRACAVIEAAREEQDAAWETYAEQVSA